MPKRGAGLQAPCYRGAPQDYSSALQNYQKLLKLTPYNPAINYHIARMHALLGASEQAMFSLKKSLGMGYDFGAKIDSSLKSLEQLSGYTEIQNLIDQMKSPVSNSHIVFTVPEKDLIPEGIAYDAVDDCFYMGSIWKCKIIK